MNRTIQQLLANREENHLLPFFWQHGEDETTLREMMAAIHGANCRAVCVESRPHPDFCGDKWWQDMDVILDEARKRDMRVWILDDSHFPTGFANGALRTGHTELCRQGILQNKLTLGPEAGDVTVDLREEGLLETAKKEPSNPLEAHFMSIPPARVFDDDRVFHVSLKTADRETDLTDQVRDGRLSFEKPEGEAELRVLILSRNTGAHRDLHQHDAAGERTGADRHGV